MAAILVIIQLQEKVNVLLEEMTLLIRFDLIIVLQIKLNYF